MTAPTATTDDVTGPWRDPKKWAWLLGGAYAACLPLWAVGFYYLTGGAAWSALFLPVHIFIALPLLDMLVGEDPTNPPEAAVGGLTNDPHYMRIAALLVPLSYVAMATGLGFLTVTDLPLWGRAAFVLGLGIGSGTLIILGHELGHKTGAFERLMARFALGAVGYGHFTAEHNLGHHKNVSTPEDCASARMGETIFDFARREIPGALRGAITIEGARLAKRGHRFWSRHNEILQTLAITLSYGALLVLAFGPEVLFYLLPVQALAWTSLSLVNYIEHYGLLRARRADGRYEPCQPHHSWNTNHIVSNVLQIHLQRHSDHHTHPLRPYQALRNYPDLPRLPSGYPGCLALAAIPPLWFKVMDKRVMAWADGDLARVNVHPPARARLQRKWGSKASSAISSVD